MHLRSVGGLAQVIVGDQTPDKADSWKRRAFAVGAVGDEKDFSSAGGVEREEGKLVWREVRRPERKEC